MTRSKGITISGPFDARHVGGVNISGSTISTVDIPGVEPAPLLEPDEVPVHTNVATGTTEIPQRSNTISDSLRRPSLRLRTSISRLRARSSSNSPDTYHRRANSLVPEVPKSDHTAGSSINMPPHNPPHNLGMKSSMSRLRQRVGLDKDHSDHTVPKLKEVPIQQELEKEPKPEIIPEPIQKDYPPLRVKSSRSRLATASHVSAEQAVDPNPSLSAYNSTSVILRRQPTPPQAPRPPTVVRPKRADSGTAIDFNDVPVEERPLAFKEIVAKSSFAERMALYTKTREYWAKADHGLGEWVGRTGGPLVFRV